MQDYDSKFGLIQLVDFSHYDPSWTDKLPVGGADILTNK